MRSDKQKRDDWGKIQRNRKYEVRNEYYNMHLKNRQLTVWTTIQYVMEKRNIMFGFCQGK